MFAVATIWLFLCFPQCIPQNAVKVEMGVHNETLKLTEEEAKESHGQETDAMVSIEGDLKSSLKEPLGTTPEAVKIEHPSPNMESSRLLTENESQQIVEDNYHNSESQTSTFTPSFEDSSVSDLKIPEIFAPVKEKYKKHDEIKSIHKFIRVDLKDPARVSADHGASVDGQVSKSHASIQTEDSDTAVKVDKIEKFEEPKEVSSNIQDRKDEPPLEEEMQLEKGPEPPEVQKPLETLEPPTEEAGNMPSFNEWTQKRLAEQEQKGSNVPSSASTQGASVSKMRQKNYASADCGAKILGTNSEAQSAYAVLNGYHDEYMLNPCTAKIWLVIELCEPIQAQKMELANFELFSSSPREFTISSSDRYPSRDWVVLGSFEAREEKNIQSFPLDQKMFQKFIKIEFSSHYGSEHYCPLSLVRVYGTSELEVLDNDDDHAQPGAHDLDGDGLPDDYEIPDESQSPNLFGSAKDAVMSIVKKAAEALSRDKNVQEVPLPNATLANITDDSDMFLSVTPNLTDHCVTVVQSTREDKSSETAEVTREAIEKTLSCSYQFLVNLLALELVDEIMRTCSLCNDSSYAISTNTSQMQLKCLYLRVLIGPVRFAALCNLYKLNLELLSLKPLSDIKLYPNVTEITPGFETPGVDIGMSTTTPIFGSVEEKSTPSTQCGGSESSSTITEILSETPPLPDSGPVVSSPDLPNGVVTSSQSLQELIQPTKTLKPDDIMGEVAGASEAVVEAGKSEGMPLPFEDQQENLEVEDLDKSVVEDGVEVEGASFVSANENVIEMIEKSASGSESLLVEPTRVDVSPELATEGTLPPVQSATVTPGIKKDVPAAGGTAPVISSNKTGTTSMTGNTQKESVFVRLSNRIKALELNMSLSTQYLEELSQRYRKQMEEMQKAFNKTISALNETAKKAQEQDIKQQEVINTLQSQIDNLSTTVDILLADRESLGAKILEPHVFIIFVELVLAAFMYALLRRHSVRYLRLLNRSGDETLSDAPTNNVVKLNTMNGKEEAAVKRRNSFSGHSSSYHKPQRRPSEEALNISGTYADLMIVEPVIPIMVDQPKVGEGKRRKRHKKSSRESLEGALDDNALNFTTNVHRKQSTGKLTKSAGLLFSATKNLKSDRTNNSILSHVNSKQTNCQMAKENRKSWNCAKLPMMTSSCVAKEFRANVCCDVSQKRPSESFCNGVQSKSINGVVKNKYVSGIDKEDKVEEYSLKKLFQRTFWWLRK